jgi:formylglycine-generating enzyme required for sulfatase activity
VTGSTDETAKVWDAQSGKELLTLKGHSSSVNPVAFSPDGTRFASGSTDGTAKVWGIGDRVTKSATLDFVSITKEQPYVNSLGMKFVPVPGTNVLFSIWETRVKDYKVFGEATKREWPKPTFEQNEEHPAVNVSWEDATAFCEWLTQQERKAGRISTKQGYRLPTDLEWSAAVGLEKEEGKTPQARDAKVKGVYPWGTQWPPPTNAGNYDASVKAPVSASASLSVDAYKETSPVGSFGANRYGIYDLGGNVWEWCQDWYDVGMKQGRVLRGASWSSGGPGYLLSSCRRGSRPESQRGDDGFRCVLGELETVSAKNERSSLPLESLSPSATPHDIGAQKLTKVFVKKYGVSTLLPTDVFPDAKKLSNSDQSFLQGNSWTGQTTLTFSSVREPLAKVYAECATEHSPQAPSKTVQYKVLKPTWFVVSGDLGPETDASLGFYTKGVKKDNFVVIMHFQWREDDFPFSEETFTAMSRGFDGN